MSHPYSDTFCCTGEAIKRDNVKLTLDKAMDFFMDIEEYEKCAHIKKIKDLLQKNLPM